MIIFYGIYQPLNAQEVKHRFSIWTFVWLPKLMRINLSTSGYKYEALPSRELTLCESNEDELNE